MTQPTQVGRKDLAQIHTPSEARRDFEIAQVVMSITPPFEPDRSLARRIGRM